MKALVTLSFLFLSLALHGQEIIDNKATIRAEYEFLYKTDPGSTKYSSDLLSLDICESGQSFFYSRNQAYRDSVKRVCLQEGLSPYETMGKIRRLPTGAGWIVNKHFKNNKYRYIHKMIKSYSAEFDLVIPLWSLLPDTLTINGFFCRKATASFLGRSWIAWFTPQIVSNDGPWMLWGLPGLIIKATDSDNYFSFTCVDAGKLPEPYYVSVTSDFYATRQISFQQMLNLEKMYNTDVDSYIEQVAGARKMGERNNKRKYIPLAVKH